MLDKWNRVPSGTKRKPCRSRESAWGCSRGACQNQRQLESSPTLVRYASVFSKYVFLGLASLRCKK